MRNGQRRETISRLLDAAVDAVDPEVLTHEALTGCDLDAPILIAIGKAAAGMCRGAERALGPVSGVCVTNVEDVVPEGVEVMVGDHPVPGTRSFAAGQRVLQLAAQAKREILALVSGGGSALCEYPIPGVSTDYIIQTTSQLLASGAPITEINLVRRHLSAIKNGGLGQAASAPVSTLAISDVCGADPGVIASGPTSFQPFDAEGAITVMTRHGVVVPSDVREAMRQLASRETGNAPVRIIGDGHTATNAVVAAAKAEGIPATRAEAWIEGDLEKALDGFLAAAGPGLTVGAGEPDVVVTGTGSGGRNTHAALLAATRIFGSESLFAAFATDGADGNSSSAGAIVDGSTLSRGGDPHRSLETSDSAAYLRRSGDLIVVGPTGTNVSDLWLLWK